MLKLKILNESDNILVQPTAYAANKFRGYLINNNPVTFSKREYILQVEGLPYSYDTSHPKHKEWTKFLEDNPHLISNFDTSDPCKLEYLFERWQIMHNNG